MKMHPESWKFYRVVYSLAILWCCMIKANGDTDTNVDPLMVTKTDSNSDLFKILSGTQNERKINPLNSILSMNIHAGTVNFNIPINLPGSNIIEPQNNSSIKNVSDDYTLAEGIGYHKLHTSQLNWNNARKACMEENAHLVVINSLKEAEVLGQLMIANQDVRSAYIGAHDMFLEGEWITIHGESLESAGFNMWAPDEPNNADGNEHCAVLRNNRTMNDVSCSFEWYYICEIPL